VKAAGLYDQWLKEKLEESSRRAGGDPSGERLVVLTLNHLIFGFLLLLGGHALAALCFLGEILHVRLCGGGIGGKERSIGRGE